MSRLVSASWASRQNRGVGTETGSPDRPGRTSGLSPDRALADFRMFRTPSLTYVACGVDDPDRVGHLLAGANDPPDTAQGSWKRMRWCGLGPIENSGFDMSFLSCWS